MPVVNPMVDLSIQSLKPGGVCWAGTRCLVAGYEAVSDQTTRRSGHAAATAGITVLSSLAAFMLGVRFAGMTSAGKPRPPSAGPRQSATPSGRADASEPRVEAPPSQPPRDSERPQVVADDASRLALARDSYREVLQATEHQDDKVGRALGAIAFLLAAALLFLQPEMVQAVYRVSGRELPLLAFALVAFLLLILGGALTYVLATGTPLSFPSPQPGSTPATSAEEKSDAGVPEGRPESFLYFRMIGRTNLETWRQAWKQGDSISEWVLEDYVDETHNLAIRATTKYRRSTFASVLVVLALLLLAIVLILAVQVLINLELDNTGALVLPRVLSLTNPVRAAIALALFGFGTLVTAQRFRGVRNDPSADLADEITVVLLGVAYAGWGPAVIATADASVMERILAITAMVGATLIGVLGFWRLLRARSRSAAIGTAIAAFLFAAIAAWSIWFEVLLAQLTLAIVVTTTPLLAQPLSAFARFRKSIRRR